MCIYRYTRHSLACILYHVLSPRPPILVGITIIILIMIIVIVIIIVIIIRSSSSSSSSSSRSTSEALPVHRPLRALAAAEEDEGAEPPLLLL